MNEDKFSGMGSILAAMTAPKWVLKQHYELENLREKLYLFCTVENVKEFEKLAFDSAISRLDSNHEIVCEALSFIYDEFSKGKIYTEIVESLKTHLEGQATIEYIRVQFYGR